MSIQTDDFAAAPAPSRRALSAVAASPAEDVMERALRPRVLDEYVGQGKAREQLEIFIGAARQRGEALDHVLLFGPPGLGKTTLSHIIAAELGVNLRQTSGPVLEKPKDLAAILTNLERNDVLFIDEIHRLSPVVEEILYPALEDYQIDIMIGEGPAARSIKLDLQPFTLVGATTRAGLLTQALRSRFGIAHHLEFYGHDDLVGILERASRILSMQGITADAFDAIAARSRGTPRIAIRLLRRVRDFAAVRGTGRADRAAVDGALRLEGIDERGLDELDRKYMRAIAEIYGGGPVGVEAVAATLAEDVGTIEDMVEPYLLQLGYLARTRQGRRLTKPGADSIGFALPANQSFDA